MDTIYALLDSMHAEPCIIFAQVILFYIFHLLMTQIIYKPLAAVRKKRRAETVAKVEKAEAINKETLKIKSKYEEEIRRVHQEAAELIQETQRRAEKERQKRLSAARDEAARIVERAKAEVKLEEKRLGNELSGDVSQLALQMAQRIISSVTDGAGRERAEKALAIAEKALAGEGVR
ncbi:F0F1 ATP synthase subunit B [bacterium]|nr:F0F1 ATP synthase subunit B [bacterium]